MADLEWYRVIELCMQMQDGLAYFVHLEQGTFPHFLERTHLSSLLLAG